ncbi:MAG TPA: SDR family NAD(P)-dependent oxidoreductase [Acidimicrobiales bacterium]|nr:SDR family NAD(P)-dependent oxidoreductase [Acidimicrobiales bacterium]
MRLHGEVALVTGSSRGVGEAIAQALAREGANVVVTGRDAARGDAAARRIEESGGSAAFVQGDVGVEDDVRRMVSAAADRFGGLTVLVNNAPPIEVGLVEVADLGTASWDATIRTGLTAVFWAMKYAIPEMDRAGHGSIINISSGASVAAMAGRSAYAAAKGAVNALTRTVAAEYGPRNIRCNALVLGFVAAPELIADGTPGAMIAGLVRPLQMTRIGTPEDVAHAAVYLASRESEYLTGAELRLDGGQTAKGADLRQLFATTPGR